MSRTSQDLIKTNYLWRRKNGIDVISVKLVKPLILWWHKYMVDELDDNMDGISSSKRTENGSFIRVCRTSKIRKSSNGDERKS